MELYPNVGETYQAVVLLDLLHLSQSFLCQVDAVDLQVCHDLDREAASKLAKRLLTYNSMFFVELRS